MLRLAHAATERISALEIGAGGHWVGEGEVDFRVELAGVLWLPAARRVGLSLELSSGPGLRIDHPDFSGHYRELVVGAKARFRLVQLHHFSLAVALGGAAHWAMLQGTLAEDARAQREPPERFARLRNLGQLQGQQQRLPRHLAGCRLLPAYRRYLVGGEPVFAPWPVAVILEDTLVWSFSSFSPALLARSVRSGFRVAVAKTSSSGRSDGDQAPPGDCSASVPEGLIAARPPMGWNGYNAFGCEPELDEAKLKATSKR